MERAVRAGQRPKLLHVFPSFARGGQQVRLAAIADGLGDEFTHRIVSLDGDVSARDAFVRVDVETFGARKSRVISAANVTGFARLVKDSGADVLCTYNFGSIEAALANSLLSRRPHIHHEDGFGPDEAPNRQKLRRVLLRRLSLSRSQTIVPSRTLESVAKDGWRLPPSRVRRIPNGIDVDKFASARQPRSDNRPLTVGFVGALRAEKNVARLMTAFASAPRDAQLSIYGDGPERERLAQIAAKSGGRITLEGATSKPEQAYARFDIFALSSDTEQMPFSLMEAMASGLPVVATDVGDIKDMLAPGNRALVVSPEDEAAYASSLTQLLADAGLRARLGAANADKARREFGVARMVAAHGALYREVLAASR